MDNLELVFGQSENAAGSPVEIVFGDDDGGLPSGVVELGITGRITGLRGTIAIHRRVEVHAAGRITGLRGTIQVLHTINVSRPLVNASRGAWQNAQRASHALQIRYERAGQIGIGVQSGYQLAERVSLSVLGRFEQTTRLSRSVLQAFQQAQRVGAVPVLQRFESAGNVRAVVAHGFEQARRASGAPVLEQYADALHLKHIVVQRYEKSLQLSRGLADSFGVADRWSRALQARYEYARKPAAGKTPIVKPPYPALEPCYVPGLPAELLFIEAADASLPVQLVFVCERHSPPGPDPDRPKFVIPLLEKYVSVHHIDAVLLPGLEPIKLDSAEIESDDDSFGWSLNAIGPEHLLDQLAPVSGLPAQIRVTVDGIPWVFAVERMSRTRSFGKHRVSLDARSVTALLGDPYSRQQTWLNDAGALTAQQIVAKALEYTGTAVDWGLNDWLVPAGAWSFRGTPLQAALRVAESVGAVLRSHRTEQQLIFAPRYPSLPWEWSSKPANVQMPAAIITTDSLEPQPNPAYNAVFVSGMAQGVRGHVRRVGTAGDLRAEPITDALITHEVAARERGRSILGAAGNKLMQTMTLPLLTGADLPGLIGPGNLIRVDDINEQWRGLVRSIRVSVGMPKVRQIISVERQA